MNGYCALYLSCLCLIAQVVNYAVSQTEIPVDGGWQPWDDWSVCSVTCGGGIQTRERACVDPVPTPGGRECDGDAIESRTCADWECPDCVSGIDCREGRLDSSCSLCWCSRDYVITGRVELPYYPQTYLSGVRVYARGREWDPLTVTDCDGAFEIRELCHDHTVLIFIKEGYVAEHATYDVAEDSRVDMGEITMYEESKPVIILQPESYLLQEGSGVVMKCASEGRPPPTTFKWFKNGQVAEIGDQNDDINRDGQLSTSLLIRDALVEHSGEYQCVATSSAGSTWSQPGTLLVYTESDATEEEAGGSCSDTLSPKQVVLPDSCTAMVNGQTVTTVDIGSCARDPCPYIPGAMAGPTPANGPTGPLVGCCGPTDISLLTVSCDGGVSYPLVQVNKCGCHPSMPDQNPGVMVEGIVRMARYRNGQLTWENVPKLNFGVAGGVLTSTSTTTTETGEFVVSLIPTSKTLTFKFQTHFNRLNVFPHTSVIHLVEGVHTYRTIIHLRERPAPLNISVEELSTAAGHTFTFPQPGQTKRKSPGTITLQETVLLDRSGRSLQQNSFVNVSIDFLDTRHGDDFATSPGEMLLDETDGEPRLLKTYGMFWLQIEQDQEVVHGDCPGEIQLKPTEIKLPHPQHSCKLDPMLWVLGKSVSQWKPWSMLQKVAVCDRLAYGKKARDLYAGNGMSKYQAPSSSPALNIWRPGRMAESTTSFLWDRPGFNIAEVIPRVDLCVVAVRVFMGPSSPSAQPLSGEQVVVYSRNPKTDRLVSFQSMFTGKDGKACVLVPCASRHTIRVWSLYDATTSTTHNLPADFIFLNSQDKLSVEFTSPLADSIHHTSHQPSGPVHRYIYHSCSESRPSLDDYYFSFFAETAPVPHFLSAVNLGQGTLLSWYHEETRFTADDTESCFVRVAIQTVHGPNTQVVATSWYGEEDGGELYGTSTTGVHHIYNLTEGAPRAGDGFACVQVKCPGDLTDDMGQIYEDVATRVSLEVMVPRGETCRLRWIADYLVSDTSSREDGGRVLPLNIRESSNSSLTLVLNPVSYSDSYDYDYWMPGFYRDRGSNRDDSPSQVRGHCIADSSASLALFDCADGDFPTDWWDERSPPGDVWELNDPVRPDDD